MKILMELRNRFFTKTEMQLYDGKKIVVVFFALLLAFPGVEANAFDAERAHDLMGVCATCHGEFGQGGARGEYPRLAGQSEKYIASQLYSFRARIRINIPMFPYTEERELSDEDIHAVAGYLASIKLPTTPPTFKGNEDALTRLQMMEKVMIVPRVEGDIVNGGNIYQEGCASCHNKTGRGRGAYPMLAGQYSNYLLKQVNSYRKGERPHDEADSRGILSTLKDTDIQDILAYLTSIQARD